MYLLLTYKKRLFSQYSYKTHRLLLEYDGLDNKKEIVDWIGKKLGFSVVNVVEENRGIIIVSVIEVNECKYGEFITFHAAQKLLENSELDVAINEYIEKQKAQASIKLRYGVKNNSIVSIDEITETEKGLNCQCVCPGCGVPLQARLGKGRRQRHFAHNNESCNIIAAQQSALHMLAKEIIEREKRVCLPPVSVHLKEIGDIGFDFTQFEDLPDELAYKSSEMVSCDKVILEKRISDFVPDIIIETAGETYLIEVAVTHFVDEEKYEKVQRLGIPMMEIDLSSVYGKEISREELGKIIVEQSTLKTWVYNPKKFEALRYAKSWYKTKCEEIKIEEERRRLKEAENRKQKQLKQEKARKKIEELFIPENYRDSLLALRDDTAAIAAWKRRSCYKSNTEIPFYMDIPITGEMVFKCDRRIWQSAIFDCFVYNRKISESEKPTLHIRKIANWIFNYQKEFQLDWEMVPETFIFIRDSGYNRSLFYECVKQYLEYLCSLGFIKRFRSQEYTVLSSHSLIAPNKKEAIELAAILESVDLYANNVTDRIYAFLHPHHVILMPPIQDMSERYGQDEYGAIKEAREKQEIESKRIKYQAGFKEVVEGGYFLKDIAKDSFGYRWLICTECGEIKREEEMTSYSGTTGQCRECSRANR